MPAWASFSSGVRISVPTFTWAQTPEDDKKKLFFANPWGIAFTNRSGDGEAYVISAGSDLLVKVNVSAGGTLSFTSGQSMTTRYIDLNDPANPATSGVNAGKNPQGIVINESGTTAYVANLFPATYRLSIWPRTA
jgi:DNA-binding beta-propeller fold protein YncE